VPEVNRVDNVPIETHAVSMSLRYRTCIGDRGYVNTLDGRLSDKATCYECGARVQYSLKDYESILQDVVLKPDTE
jgi:hypothetical protein